MEQETLNALQTKAAYFPGGHDREAHHLIVVPVPVELHPWTKPHLETCLRYIISSLRDETKSSGFVVIIDAQKCSWRLARAHIRYVLALVDLYLRNLIVIRPDAFWDKKHVVEHCAKSNKKGEPIILSKSRLAKYFDLSDLPVDLGGTIDYSHDRWIENRVRFEEFKSIHEKAINDLENLHLILLDSKSARVSETAQALNTCHQLREDVNKSLDYSIEIGTSLMSFVENQYRDSSRRISWDNLDLMEMTKSMLTDMESKRNTVTSAWVELEKSIETSKELSILEEGVTFVTNWILRTAEGMLNDQNKVGYDVATSEELRNKHELLEMQCLETYGFYAELLHKITVLPIPKDSYSHTDLMSQKDFMDFVCRSFATRLERRRNILITSVRFFRLVSNYFDKTSEVFDALILGNKVDDFERAPKVLQKLKDSQQSLENLEKELIKEGEKLSDMLAMPVKDALGCDLGTDYSEDIINIRDILDATIARRNIFIDSVELQKLTLEQVLHIQSYEQDAEMAIKWIDDLYNVMLKTHMFIGTSVKEIQNQKDELQSIQDTAKEIYGYGCQLLEASMALRQSCRISTEKNIDYGTSLKTKWMKLDEISQEQMTRLRVSTVFHRSIEDYLLKLADLKIRADNLEEESALRKFLHSRERLFIEIGRTQRLGRLLKSRLRESISMSQDSAVKIQPDNNIACDAIVNKLNEVTRVAEELDNILKGSKIRSLEGVEESSSQLVKETTLEDKTEDESFNTASEYTWTPQSRSSSYHTASECRTSPWWDSEKNSEVDFDSLQIRLLPEGVSSASNSFDESETSFITASVRSPVTSDAIDSDDVQKRQNKKRVDLSKDSSLEEESCSSTISQDSCPGSETPQTSEIIATNGNNGDNEQEDEEEKRKKSGDQYHIKVVELEPKLTFLGTNLDEAVHLQTQHDELLGKLQGQTNPIDEFLRKVDDMAAAQKPRVEILNAMEASISRIWDDLESLLIRRKRIADVNSNFHEKFATCQSKISALELACRDTMIPMEVEPVEDFLNKFKSMRTEVLASVLATLRDGKELLGLLREIASEGTVDSRPDHLVHDAIKAIKQVEIWLEQLHDRRNGLETAWQSRKDQLEQCLKLAMLSKELIELEDTLNSRQNDMAIAFTLGESEKMVDNLLREYVLFKDDAVSLRDRTIRITKTIENLVRSGSFNSDEACAQSYSILARCTDFLDEVDRRESLLLQAKDFFHRAELALKQIEGFEVEIASLKKPNCQKDPVKVYTEILSQLEQTVQKPIQLGYCLMDDVGRTRPEVMGVKRVIDEIENRKIYLEEICTANTEQAIDVSEKINSFFSHHNQILSWLVSVAEVFIKTTSCMGTSLESARSFLAAHHRILSDLEIRGTDINNLLLKLTPVLEQIDEEQRKDVDVKVQSLHQHWTKLKDIVNVRTDLATLYIQFLDESNSLAKAFDKVEVILKTAPNEENLKQIEKAWTIIQPSFVEIKKTGARFIDEVSKVADPYLETKTARSNVEEILRDFSNRQFSITESCDNWSRIVTEKREVEILWERIMTENVQTLNIASKIDSQLYPILSLPSEDPEELRIFVQKRLSDVLQEIGNAKSELQDRIKSTAHLEPNDADTNTKLHQVIDNLQSIKMKLDGISNNYEALAISMMSFFEAILKTKTEIGDYFEKNRQTNDENSVTNHQQFREKVMEQFRTLISQSETIIERIRNNEPDGAKEHDTDRIITLLERLRITFESQAESKQNDLIEYNTLNQFKKDLRDIHSNLDDVTKQLMNPTGDANSLDGYGTAAAMKAVAFDYFEQTIELLEKRVDKFISSSEVIYLKYPKLEVFVKDELTKLKSRWQEILEMTRKRKQELKLSADYHKFLEEVKSQYRNHNNYLQQIASKSTFTSQIAEADDLVNQIDHYINQYETRQLNDLKRLSDMSKELYGFDKSVSLYTDNLTVFDTFLKIKSKLIDFVERARTEEMEKQQRLLQEQMAKKPPVFTMKLFDISIPEGEQYIFRCHVSGYPTPNVEWYKDGISIQSNSDYHTTYNNGACTLTIEETLIADSATFSCKATNSAGQDITTAKLIVRENIPIEKLEAPVFAQPLNTGFAKEGGSFCFECTVSGHPLPVVQWFKNNNCIDQLPDYIITYNNGQAKLKIEEVFLEDQTAFTCRASNPVGVAETVANLIVEPLEPTQAPIFTSQLSNVMARVGQKIKLECDVTGIPEPSLIWMQNEKLINSNNRDIKTHYDGRRATLIIPEAFLKDAGVYSVIARNLAGEKTSTCNVSVKGRIPNETSDSELASDIEPIKPTVQMPLRDSTVGEGKSIRLDCIIVGQPEPEVIWYHEGRPVKESQDFQLIFQGDRCSLLIQEALPEDCGEYKVVAINSAGEISSKCHLTVISTKSEFDKIERIIPIEIPLQFNKLLTDVLVSEGERVVLECSVSGTPRPDIKWYWNNTEIKESLNTKMTYDADGNVKLIIERASIDDKGLYTVRASNTSGDIKSFSHLIVKAVNIPDSQRQIHEVELEEKLICPTFKELFSDKNVPEGSSTKFECIVEGKPSPKIKWFFNDQLVHGQDFLISTSGNRQVLSVPEAKKSIAGKISCVAENEIGKATCTAYLNVHESSVVETHVELPDNQTYTQEHNTQSSLVTIKKQTFTTTSHQHISSVESGIPQTHLYTHSLPSGLDNKQYKEYHQEDDLPVNVQQKSVINVIRPITVESTSLRQIRKDVAPRFITPLIGKIVDQGSTVTIEALVDGSPSPEIKLFKNGEPLLATNRNILSVDHNKISITLKDVVVTDAGRYSCVASNSAGTSTSVADLVVKKSVFPPVFGKRLQTQIVKVGEKVIMDVEITGLPEPTVAWFKDDVPIENHPQYKIHQIGNCHKLVIEHASKMDAGKFMVSAINPGGKAESIASFAVVDSTPDRIVEVVKTVVFEDPKDHTRKTHGKSEDSHFTETRRVTEATMKMEHKPLADLSDLIVPTKTHSISIQNITGSTIQSIDLPNLEPGPQPVMGFMPPMPHFHRTEVCASPKPSSEAVAMERLWAAPKVSDHIKSIAIETAPSPPTVVSKEVTQTSISSTRKKFEEIIKHSENQEIPLRAPGMVRSVKPWQERPKSDIYSDLILEPGSPPEICYAPKPAFERKKSLVETLEENIEKQLEVEPARVPPGGVRLLPHKREKSLPPVLSAPIAKPEPVLEPFPFQVPEATSKAPIVIPPPATPSKFVKGMVTESNYESDFSDYSCFDSKYKHVEPPRSKSIEPPGVSSSDEKPVYDFKTLPLKRMIQEGRPIPLPASPVTIKPSRPVSGYVADTEDYYQSKTQNHIYDSQFTTTKHEDHSNYPTPGTESKEVSTSSLMKNISMTSKQIRIMEEPIIEIDYGKRGSMKLPPPASPSKFVKSEFRESDYESEFEGRVAPMWKPYDSDSEPQYRPVRVNLTPTGRHSKYSDGAKSPTPPTQFDKIPQFEGPPRPKFKPIEKPSPNVQYQTVHKPTPVTASGHQPTINTNYFTAVAGHPVHNAIETSNTMQMREHSESSHRVVNMNKTTRIINFDNQLYGAPEPFPYQTSPTSMQSKARVAPPPTPTKFVKGEFRESDYESEVDSAKIRPVWTPNQSDSEGPHYRHVQPPRSSSCPRSYPSERVLTPMEFDKQPPLMPQDPQTNDYFRKEVKSHTMDHSSSRMYHTQQSPTSHLNQVRFNAEDMNRSFRQKAGQFIHDISKDVQQPQKPILKKAGRDQPQVYRDESRISQYGTKCVDPDTGLIYFKYDFGYEFGILFPGEGKKFVGGLKRATSPPKALPRSGDIEMPVIHERSQHFDNGVDGSSKRYSLPIQIDLDHLHDTHSQSPAFTYNPDNTRSKSIPPRHDLPVNYHQNHNGKPKHPPMFITPMKDIAVVSGQTARFECIVQSETTPEILWAKDGVIIQPNNPKFYTEFRNGVCRLTIPRSFPDDGGVFSCSATNPLGSVSTSAHLLVPADKWGTRK